MLDIDENGSIKVIDNYFMPKVPLKQ